MWYMTLELAKERKREMIERSQIIHPVRPSLLSQILVKLGSLLVKIGKRMQARRHYGTIVHAE
jgi:hypothetical protein